MRDPVEKYQENISEIRLAVLIDADNISHQNIKGMMEEIARYGNPTIKRIYGDWTKPNLSGWKPLLLDYAITPIQQFGYTTGKNSTDSALIIDAMDILYTEQADGFCLVSSDSDFTRLAIRLREAGKTVYGIGEQKTPNAFIAACDKFIYLEILEERMQAEAEAESGQQTADTDQKLPFVKLAASKKKTTFRKTSDVVKLITTTIRDVEDDSNPISLLRPVGKFRFEKLTPMINPSVVPKSGDRPATPPKTHLYPSQIVAKLRNSPVSAPPGSVTTAMTKSKAANQIRSGGVVPCEAMLSAKSVSLLRMRSRTACASASPLRSLSSLSAKYLILISLGVPSKPGV